MLTERSALPLVPIVSVARNARSAAQYLMTVDLRHELPSDRWPCALEEVEFTCIVETHPLFTHRPLGSTKIIVHRFGGSYGPVRFLLQACEGDACGSVGVLLVDQGGLPVHRLRIEGVTVSKDAEQGQRVSLPKGIVARRSRSGPRASVAAAPKPERAEHPSMAGEFAPKIAGPSPGPRSPAPEASQPDVSPEGRIAMLRVAQAKIDRGDYAGAILEYQRVVHADPTDAHSLMRLGNLQARIDAHADALATYDRAARYYAEEGSSSKAVAAFKEMTELINQHAPQLADEYGHVPLRLAEAYTQLGLIDEALVTYDGEVRRLGNRGKDAEAVEIIRRVVSIDGANPLPQLRLAEALVRTGQVGEAIECFWRGVELLKQQGRTDDALKVLERILHFRQDLRAARSAAQLYLSKNTRAAALPALSRLQLCFEADPRDLDTLSLLGQAFEVIGQPAKAGEVFREMLRIASETGQKGLEERYLRELLRLVPDAPEGRDLHRERESVPAAVAPTPAEQTAAPQAVPVVERTQVLEALEEAEFFASRGLFEDASLILRDHLSQYPDAPELLAALEKVDARRNREPERKAAETTDDAALDEDDEFGDAILDEDDRFVDAKDLVHPVEGGDVHTGSPEMNQPIDVDEVFARFRQEAKALISDSDSATHYDLGVAYKEMGLFADAIREFEIASRDPKRECNCLAMLGMIHRELGDLDRAAEAFVRGLNAQHKTVAQEVSLYYDLASVYEQKQDPDEAVYYFRRILRRDPTYRDVAQRVNALLPRTRRFAPPSPVDDQELDDDSDEPHERKGD